MGNYCQDCVTKWPRCICKPESDQDDDQNYIVEAQTDNPSNVKYDGHPIPLDWSSQEHFWNGKAYKNPNRMAMTLTGMTICTHRIKGQKLNPR